MPQQRIAYIMPNQTALPAGEDLQDLPSINFIPMRVLDVFVELVVVAARVVTELTRDTIVLSVALHVPPVVGTVVCAIVTLGTLVLFLSSV